MMQITRQILAQRIEDNVGASTKVDPITITIDLTEQEIEAIYRLREEYYNKCDLYNKLNNMIGNDDDCDTEISCSDIDEFEIGSVTVTGKKLKEIVTPEFMDGLVDVFQDALGRNDGYWESFWMTAEEVIEEAIEDEMKEDE